MIPLMRCLSFLVNNLCFYSHFIYCIPIPLYTHPGAIWYIYITICIHRFKTILISFEKNVRSQLQTFYIGMDPNHFIIIRIAYGRHHMSLRWTNAVNFNICAYRFSR